MDDKTVFSSEYVTQGGDQDTGRVLFKENSSYIICGRSGSGKTTFIYNFLKNIESMCHNVKNRKINVLYCYDTQQPLYSKMKEELTNVTFKYGIPDEETIERMTDPKNRHLILVVDDLMGKVISSQLIFDFVTVKAHHRGTSVFYISHNLFQQGKFSRAITLNASYLILFQNPRGADQIQTLSRQIFPGKRDAITQAYRLAMKIRPYSYLVIDMTANVPDELRMRSCVFPGEVMRFFSFNI